MPTAPLIPPSDHTTNHVSERRAATRKGASAVAADYPLLTMSAYNKVVQGKPGDVGDKGLLALARARASLNTALLLVGAASKHYNPQVGSTPDEQVARAPIYNALRGQYEALERLVLKFPLEVR